MKIEVFTLAIAALLTVAPVLWRRSAGATYRCAN
jgi:hypothetical protein